MQVFDQVTANAPPGVKLFSKLFKPLVSKFVNMAAENQKEIQLLHDSARDLISRDSGLSSVLGADLQFSPPLQQFQSNVNGRTEATLQFQVIGKTQGMVMLSSRDGSISQLLVEVAGRHFDVGTKPPDSIKGKGGTGTTRFDIDDDDGEFMEADFKEKDK
ncbi:hypothetical protein TL16_g02694 [Triparma laevis f. inornata]|uniref:Uncharacterized protein n=1 Tax=Triparma laevis f. inornata TaxID=1714386 RepID=A0A9W6ZWV6_9STRA|nr:hypothetical protein TL16_g02694 [Triparma laevis f. inornata]